MTEIFDFLETGESCQLEIPGLDYALTLPWVWLLGEEKDTRIVSLNLIGISSFLPSVPKAAQAKVMAELKKMKEGKDDSFLGPIKDQEGKEMISAGKRATDKELLTMKWFAEGVVGKIPE